MGRILIVDDDRKIRELLQEYLRTQGFEADAAESAARADEFIKHVEYSLIVVDVMMPGENGIEFTKRFKKAKDTPVLMLTAKGETADRIAGLENGADDYLPKPFDPKELYLRITKLIERSAVASTITTGDKITRFGEFQFNDESRILTKNDERIGLSSTESELLSILCRNINKSVDRFELAQKFNGISERSVDVQVTRLRKKIEDDPKNPRYIQTNRGKGYIFRI